jgi:hypothetical protein
VTSLILVAITNCVVLAACNAVAARMLLAVLRSNLHDPTSDYYRRTASVLRKLLVVTSLGCVLPIISLASLFFLNPGSTDAVYTAALYATADGARLVPLTAYVAMLSRSHKDQQRSVANSSAPQRSKPVVVKIESPGAAPAVSICVATKQQGAAT